MQNYPLADTLHGYTVLVGSCLLVAGTVCVIRAAALSP